MAISRKTKQNISDIEADMLGEGERPMIDTALWCLPEWRINCK